MIDKSHILNILSQTRPEVSWDKSNDFLMEGLIDSFDIILITAAIERDYNIKIPGQEIVADNFRNLDAIIALIKRIQK